VGSETHEAPSLRQSPGVSGRGNVPRFFKTRQRVYTGLLLFVVLAGLPILAVPGLRNRLSGRIRQLKTAISGDVRPVVAAVGENREAFPKEYESPVPAMPEGLKLAMEVGTAALARSAPPVPPAPARKAPRILRIPTASPAEIPDGEPEAIRGEPAARESEPEPGLDYRQGRAEKDAYDLLLKSDAVVAGMVQGSNSSLHFKSWSAANRGEEVYWVRLTFQSEEKLDVEFIWEVRPATGKVTPLSYNARSLSQLR